MEIDGDNDCDDAGDDEIVIIGDDVEGITSEFSIVVAVVGDIGSDDDVKVVADVDCVVFVVVILVVLIVVVDDKFIFEVPLFDVITVVVGVVIVVDDDDIDDGVTIDDDIFFCFFFRTG